jgi:hypothetical protein
MSNTVSPDEKFQGRPLRSWFTDVVDMIAEASDADLLRWYRISTSASPKALSTSDWHPDVVREVNTDIVDILRTDTDFLKRWMLFALMSSRMWTVHTLTQWLCLQAGNCALASYIESDSYPRWLPLGQASPTEAKTEAKTDTPPSKTTSTPASKSPPSKPTSKESTSGKRPKQSGSGARAAGSTNRQEHATTSKEA